MVLEPGQHGTDPHTVLGCRPCRFSMRTICLTLNGDSSTCQEAFRDGLGLANR